MRFLDRVIDSNSLSSKLSNDPLNISRLSNKFTQEQYVQYYQNSLYLFMSVSPNTYSYINKSPEKRTEHQYDSDKSNVRKFFFLLM